MLARYATSCAVCPERIQPGDPMERLGEHGSGRWVHAACHPGESSAAPGGATGAKASATKRPVKRPVKRSPALPAAAPQPVPAGTTEVYTDGACAGNPGPGGWAWAVPGGPQASGAAPATTNQRMELTAALEAIRTLDGPLIVVSDSTYVVNCFRDGWWRGWLERDWTTSAKKAVANRDLWEPLVDLVRDRGDVTFRWVKGHAGDPMNELVDQLAVAACATN